MFCYVSQTMTDGLSFNFQDFPGLSRTSDFRGLSRSWNFQKFSKKPGLSRRRGNPGSSSCQSLHSGRSSSPGRFPTTTSRPSTSSSLLPTRSGLGDGWGDLTALAEPLLLLGRLRNYTNTRPVHTTHTH